VNSLKRKLDIIKEGNNDSQNKEKLRLGFPQAVRAVEHYQETGEIIEVGE